MLQRMHRIVRLSSSSFIARRCCHNYQFFNFLIIIMFLFICSRFLKHFVARFFFFSLSGASSVSRPRGASPQPLRPPKMSPQTRGLRPQTRGLRPQTRGLRPQYAGKAQDLSLRPPESVRAEWTRVSAKRKSSPKDDLLTETTEKLGSPKWGCRNSAQKFHGQFSVEKVKSFSIFNEVEKMKI